MAHHVMKTDLSSDTSTVSPLLFVFKHFHHQQSDTWVNCKWITSPT